MSATDYRKLIDLHGGAFIGVECSNGVDIEIGINGKRPLTATSDVIMSRIVPRLRERMNATIQDGFKTFEFGWNDSKVHLNYYDAGILLDALIGAVRHIE